MARGRGGQNPVYNGPKNSGTGGGGSDRGGRDDDDRTDSPTDSPSSGSGSGGGLTPAQARARSSDRWVDAAKNLERQARAWQYVLGKHGAIAELKTELKGLKTRLREDDRLAMEQYRNRMGSLRDMASDNEDAAGSATIAAMTNAGRERANAISEAMMQGASETDLLRAQAMALNNWHANQSEVSRNYADSVTSINASIVDLTADTKAARATAARAVMTERERQWAEYYDQISEAKTNLGNTYGQIADYYGYANEQTPGKGLRQRQDEASDKSAKYIRGAAKQTGKAWENPGIPKRIQKWEGADPIEQSFNPQMFDRPTVTALDRPEGATLRSWA